MLVALDTGSKHVNSVSQSLLKDLAPHQKHAAERTAAWEQNVRTVVSVLRKRQEKLGLSPTASKPDCDKNPSNHLDTSASVKGAAKLDLI